MGKPRRFGELELDYLPEHERREWRVQRLAWAVMGLITLAALAGLLGAGPLSQAQAGQPGSPLYLEYDRLVRYQASAQLRIFCRPPPGQDEFRLSFDRPFIERVRIQEIDPEPREFITSGQRRVYVFSSEGAEQLVIFRFEPGEFGSARSNVRLGDQAQVEINQFCFP